MNRRAFPAVAGALLLAVSVAAASAAPLPRPGDSMLYSYDVTGGQKSAGQVWVVRSTNARVTVTVSPTTAEVPGTYAFVVAAGGALSGNATDDAPQPGDPGEAPGEMARSFAAAVNLLATAANANAALWNVDVPVPGTTGTLHMVARVASADGDDHTVIAEGSGLFKLVPVSTTHESKERRGNTVKATPPPAPASVDVSMHVESSLHGGTLATAHGLTRMTLHNNTKVPAVQYTWTITAANAH